MDLWLIMQWAALYSHNNNYVLCNFLYMCNYCIMQRYNCGELTLHKTLTKLIVDFRGEQRVGRKIF